MVKYGKISDLAGDKIQKHKNHGPIWLVDQPGSMINTGAEPKLCSLSLSMYIPSGKHTKNYGQSPCSMGKSTN